jgi:outer membrane biosynthesis protein TonB
MKVTVDDLLGIRDPRGLNRMVSWSLAIHVAAVTLLILAPRLGWVKPKPPERNMVINIGGVPEAKPGPTTLGGRPIEETTPEPKRPEVVRPVETKADVIPLPTKAPPPKATKAPPPKATPAKTSTPTPQAPPKGRKAEGNTRAATAVTGTGTGLDIGGGQGNITSLDDFCCKGYLADVENRIKSRTSFNQQERGVIKIKFTVHRNGQVTDTIVDQDGPFLLRMASLRPFAGLQLPPLPAEYTQPTLTLRLTFEYK